MDHSQANSKKNSTAQVLNEQIYTRNQKKELILGTKRDSQQAKIMHDLHLQKTTRSARYKNQTTMSSPAGKRNSTKAIIMTSHQSLNQKVVDLMSSRTSNLYGDQIRESMKVNEQASLLDIRENHLQKEPILQNLYQNVKNLHQPTNSIYLSVGKDSNIKKYQSAGMSSPKGITAKQRLDYIASELQSIKNKVKVQEGEIQMRITGNIRQAMKKVSKNFALQNQEPAAKRSQSLSQTEQQFLAPQQITKRGDQFGEPYLHKNTICLSKEDQSDQKASYSNPNPNQQMDRSVQKRTSSIGVHNTASTHTNTHHLKSNNQNHDLLKVENSIITKNQSHYAKNAAPSNQDHQTNQRDLLGVNAHSYPNSFQGVGAALGESSYHSSSIPTQQMQQDIVKGINSTSYTTQTQSFLAKQEAQDILNKQNQGGQDASRQTSTQISTNINKIVGGGTNTSCNSQSANSNKLSNLSVAAKAGQMQIFSQDIKDRVGSILANTNHSTLKNTTSSSNASKSLVGQPQHQQSSSSSQQSKHQSGGAGLNLSLVGQPVYNNSNSYESQSISHNLRTGGIIQPAANKHHSHHSHQNSHYQHAASELQSLEMQANHSEPNSATFKDVRVRTPSQNKFKKAVQGASSQMIEEQQQISNQQQLPNGKIPAFKAMKIEGDLVGTRLNPTQQTFGQYVASKVEQNTADLSLGNRGGRFSIDIEQQYGGLRPNITNTYPSATNGPNANNSSNLGQQFQQRKANQFGKPSNSLYTQGNTHFGSQPMQKEDNSELMSGSLADIDLGNQRNKVSYQIAIKKQQQSDPSKGNLISRHISEQTIQDSQALNTSSISSSILQQPHRINLRQKMGGLEKHESGEETAKNSERLMGSIERPKNSQSMHFKMQNSAFKANQALANQKGPFLNQNEDSELQQSPGQNNSSYNSHQIPTQSQNNQNGRFAVSVDPANHLATNQKSQKMTVTHSGHPTNNHRRMLSQNKQLGRVPAANFGVEGESLKLNLTGQRLSSIPAGPGRGQRHLVEHQSPGMQKDGRNPADFVPSQFGMAVSSLKPNLNQNGASNSGLVSSGGADMSENSLYQSKYRSRLNQESQYVSNASQITSVSQPNNQGGSNKGGYGNSSQTNHPSIHQSPNQQSNSILYGNGNNYIPGSQYAQPSNYSNQHNSKAFSLNSNNQSGFDPNPPGITGGAILNINATHQQTTNLNNSDGRSPEQQNNQNGQNINLNNSIPSPKEANQIFQSEQVGGRVYSYHYIYDYLFVQVHEDKFNREYAQRIKIKKPFQPVLQEQRLNNQQHDHNSNHVGFGGIKRGEGNELMKTPERYRVQQTMAQSSETQLIIPPSEIVFNSPNMGGGGVSSGAPNQQDGGLNKSTILTKYSTSQGGEPNHHDSKDRLVLENPFETLNMALLDTQFDGLKLITNDSARTALPPHFVQQMHQNHQTKSNGDHTTTADTEIDKHGFKKNRIGNVEGVRGGASDSHTSSAADPDESINALLTEVGSDLQEKNKRFKVTVKKKYVNDILMQSKGAQNLAHRVILVIIRGKQLAMSNNTAVPSPTKKRKFKQSNDYSSNDEERATNNENHETESQSYQKQTNHGSKQGQSHEITFRPHGQNTPQIKSSKISQSQHGGGGNSNAIHHKRGYESENEVRSTHSTTTCSTLAPHNMRTQYTTPRNPRRLSNRSLSQIPKSVQVRRKGTDEIGGAATSGASQPLTGPSLTQATEDFANQFSDRYPPTKIKIIQNLNQNQQHLMHPINRMLADYNEFCKLVFRTRTTEKQALQNIPYAIKLGRRLGIQLTKNQLMPQTLRIRENSNAIKEKLIFHICKVLQGQNLLNSEGDHTCTQFKKEIDQDGIKHLDDVDEQIATATANKLMNTHYKCFVGKGNNSMMVRTLFKSRFWWLFSENESIDKVNFMWTQLRKNAIMHNLHTKLLSEKKKAEKAAQALVQAEKEKRIAAKKAEKMTLGDLSKQSADASLLGDSTISKDPPDSTNKFDRRKLSSTTDKSGGEGGESDQIVGNFSVGARNQSITGSVKRNTKSDLSLNKDEITPADKTTKPSDEQSVPASNTAAQQVTKAKSNIAMQQGKVPQDSSSGQPMQRMELHPYRIYNKIEDNYHLANKKALFVNMKAYYEAQNQDPFDALPVTYHVKEGLSDPNWDQFKHYYESDKGGKNDSHNIWIVKPGENTNRGVGIQVARDFAHIKEIVSDSSKSKRRTFIVQKYIHNPLLYCRRKFDIRTYALFTSVNGNQKGYFYQEGYLRTSCREFSLNHITNKYIHLTNDAIQKKCEEYGKFEPGNKLSYNEFQAYIDKNYANLNVCMERDIVPQFKKLTADCFRATWGKMDPNKRMNTFECYGLDFMLDENFKVYLIEVNTNPCLELSSPLLARLIPHMLENSLRLVVDPLFPPPEHFSQRKHCVNELCPENKFELVFDESIDGPQLIDIFQEKENVIIEIDEEELSDADVEGNKDQDQD